MVLAYDACPGACRLTDILDTLRPDDYARFVFGWIAQLLVMLFSAHQSELTFDDILKMENLLVTTSSEKIMLIGFGLPELLHNSGFSITPVAAQEDRRARDYEALRSIIDYLVVPLGSRADISLKIGKLMNNLPPVWQYSIEDLGKAILSCQLYDHVIISLNRYVTSPSLKVFNYSMTRRAMKLEAELAKQLENDRLFRLIVKFCFICERQS